MQLKPILIFLVFLTILYILYRCQKYILFIPKLIGLSFAFLTLIIPRYIDYLPEYVYLSSFKKTEELKDDVLSNNEKIIILQNQKNECYKCKIRLDNYYIKSTTGVRLNNNLSNYYAVCGRCK